MNRITNIVAVVITRFLVVEHITLYSDTAQVIGCHPSLDCEGEK